MNHEIMHKLTIDAMMISQFLTYEVALQCQTFVTLLVSKQSILESYDQRSASTVGAQQTV